ncbi:flagellar biosynthesis anti-sigma factor FlgM [Sphingosinicella soli]|uniref:Negative regulator of flagellin synthesis n=1 Tax=Sphingosinicella soli TaxID=333708 RepID=A0A7W7B2J5_9SPHN|nr:flagellar biosynthesis anti-sigma factor FlgM [Sphingosinicella soli]MBB4632832.1 negative regulator of flagellin synthesis FlgM [Sphingosinicella soli]
MVDGISGRPAGLNGASVLLDPAAAKAAGAAKTATAEAAPTPARAELSALASAARDAAAAPVDNARVAELRAAIASGSYTVDPEQIARKMVDLDLGWASQ